MKLKTPHCSHSSHFAVCECGHIKMRHDGDLENGYCLERRCKCNEFVAKPGYTEEQLTHSTIPVEGRGDTIVR